MELIPIRLAIVDDHELFSYGMKALLAEFIPLDNIAIMHDGQDLINFLEKGHQLDLILVDLQMPVTDGRAVIRHLKTKGYSIKIIVISMHDDAFVMEECKNMGSDGFIKKDSSIQVLKEGISVVMAGGEFFPMTNCNRESLGFSAKDIAKEFGLTRREMEIIRMIKNNFPSHKIAEILNISYHTVKTHRKNINQKLDINSVVSLLEFANRFRI